MIQRLPLLRAVVQRRHKVMALVPGLTPSQQLTLLALGIESASLPLRHGSINPFSRRRARSELVEQLDEWRANTAVLDCDGLLDQAWRGCLQAKMTAIHPLLPAMDLPTAATLTSRRWAPLMRPDTTAFAASANDARLAGAALGARAPSVRLLPPVTIDLAVATPEPLPAFENGLAFLGLIEQPASAAVSLYAAAAIMMQARASRAQFCLAQVPLAQVPLTQAVAAAKASREGQDALPLNRFELDLADAAAVRAAISAAHVIVIDRLAAPHMALLATALAVGRPVLAIDAPFTRDLIDAGVDGWHADAGSAGALVGAMVAILKRPDLLAGMARAARQKAMRRLGHEPAQAALFDALGLADLRVRAA